MTRPVLFHSSVFDCSGFHLHIFQLFGTQSMVVPFSALLLSSEQQAKKAAKTETVERGKRLTAKRLTATKLKSSNSGGRRHFKLHFSLAKKQIFQLKNCYKNDSFHFLSFQSITKDTTTTSPKLAGHFTFAFFFLL